MMRIAGTELSSKNMVMRHNCSRYFPATWNGIPMIYSGQELPNKKRLKFFEKDEIEWKENLNLHDFYKTLLTLHSTNKSLRAGDPEVLTQIISHPDDHQVFAYLRKHETEPSIGYFKLLR